MKARILDSLSMLSLGAAALASYLVYDRLPVQMATHFDIHGTPNGWMSRPWGAYFMPVFGLVIWGVVRVAGRIAPNGRKDSVAPGATALMALMTAVFLAALHMMVLKASLDPQFSIMRGVWVLAGAFFIALGVVLPRLRRNAVAGVRTAWSLASPEVWAKTQRVASYSMSIGGVVIIGAGLVGGSGGGFVAFAAIILASIVPAVYSYFAAREVHQP